MRLHRLFDVLFPAVVVLGASAAYVCSTPAAPVGRYSALRYTDIDYVDAPGLVTEHRADPADEPPIRKPRPYRTDLGSIFDPRDAEELPMDVPEGHLSIDDATDVVEALLAAYQLYAERECLLVIPEGEDSSQVQIVVRHNNGPLCGGDEAVAPVRDRFAVDRVTGALLFYDYETAEYLPFRPEQVEGSRCRVACMSGPRLGRGDPRAERWG